MKQHFEMFAAYNKWANGRIYAAASELTKEDYERNMGAFFGSMMGTLNHLLATDRIWMKRFTGEGEAPTTLDAVIARDFARLRLLREAEDARIQAWIGSLREEDLAGRFTYTTLSDMRRISQRLAPALAHFFNHQTHHRGQAHAILTALGRPSVVLDLAFFQRTEEGRAFA
jgi:uncharacterized damage-inducible protein DinB